MEIYSFTDKGDMRRDNQDNFWLAKLSVNDEDAGIICLCDGMGGLENGELASRMVVQAIRNYIVTKFEFDGISQVLQGVNNDIKKYSNGKMMGTTCTLLVCYKGRYKICHIGDSRAYLLRKDSSMLLTNDHSAINEYGISKKENPDLWEKYKSKLTRCIGVKDDINPDFFQGVYRDGDYFFVCSDGCWHYLEDYGFDMDNILDLEGLISVIRSYGESDNITAGILKI